MLKKKCVIQKPAFGSGDPVFLVNTYGYGQAWSGNVSDARVFNSKSQAQNHIKERQLYEARVVSESEAA